jgi:hypothetical protein
MNDATLRLCWIARWAAWRRQGASHYHTAPTDVLFIYYPAVCRMWRRCRRSLRRVVVSRGPRHHCLLFWPGGRAGRLSHRNTKCPFFVRFVFKLQVLTPPYKKVITIFFFIFFLNQILFHQRNKKVIQIYQEANLWPIYVQSLKLTMIPPPISHLHTWSYSMYITEQSRRDMIYAWVTMPEIGLVQGRGGSNFWEHDMIATILPPAMLSKPLPPHSLCTEPISCFMLASHSPHLL